MAKYTSVLSQLVHDYGREPTPEEIAHKMDIPVRTVYGRAGTEPWFSIPT